MRLLKNAAAPDIKAQTEYATWLLQVGERTIPGPTFDNGISTITTLTPQMVLPVDADIDTLIAKVNPVLRRNVGNAHYLNHRAILCTTNDEATQINDRIMATLQGQSGEFSQAIRFSITITAK